MRDAEEQSVDDFVQEVDLALMQMKSETLKKIEQALLRLEDGTYGRCQECDTEIPPRACERSPSRRCAASARRRPRARCAPRARPRPSSGCSASFRT